MYTYVFEENVYTYKSLNLKSHLLYAIDFSLIQSFHWFSSTQHNSIKTLPPRGSERTTLYCILTSLFALPPFGIASKNAHTPKAFSGDGAGGAIVGGGGGS